MRKRSNINFTLLMGILMLSGCFGRAFALVVSMHPCHYSAVQGKTLRRHWDSTARRTIADKRWHMLMLCQHHPKTLGLGIRMRQDETGWDRETGVLRLLLWARPLRIFSHRAGALAFEPHRQRCCVERYLGSPSDLFPRALAAIVCHFAPSAFSARFKAFRTCLN